MRWEGSVCKIRAAGVGQIFAWWVKGQFAQWAPGRCWSVHSQRGAAASHGAAPALLLTCPAQRTGPIDHGYGWGCQGLPVHPQHLGQDLITESGTLPSSLCQPCFLSCRADNLSPGFVANGPAGGLGFICKFWVCPLLTVHCTGLPSAARKPPLLLLGL